MKSLEKIRDRIAMLEKIIEDNVLLEVIANDICRAI